MDTPTAMLTIGGQDEVREALLDAKGVIIGRSPTCDLVLDGKEVSRRHARLFQDPFGRWIVEDLASENGVLIHGERVQAHAIMPGEKIVIGPFRLCMSQPQETEIEAGPDESSTTTLIDGAGVHRMTATG